MIWLRNIASRVLLVVFGYLGLYSHVWAWSFNGHAKLTEHALSHLDQNEKRFFLSVAERLGSDNVSLSSRLGTWADKYREATLQQLFTLFHEEVPNALQSDASRNTANWHYTNHFIYEESDLTLKDNCSLKNRGQLTLKLLLLDQVLFSNSIQLSASQEAILLALQVHMLQDLHQPLHTFTRVDQNCRHDRGGNTLCITPNATKKCDINLHSYWDAGFGVFESLEQLTPLFNEPSTFTFDPELWIQQNMNVVEHVYLSKTEHASSYLTNRYRNKARKIVEEKVSLLHHRTVSYLSRYYSKKKSHKH